MVKGVPDSSGKKRAKCCDDHDQHGYKSDFCRICQSYT